MCLHESRPGSSDTQIVALPLLISKVMMTDMHPPKLLFRRRSSLKSPVMRMTWAVVFCLAASSTAWANTMSVGPGQYTTIQSAINAANHGWTIVVRPGTYHKQINFLGKAIRYAYLFNAKHTFFCS